MRCVHIGGNYNLRGLSQCRRSDLEGPVFLLDSSLAKCIDLEDLGVLPQRGTQVSRVGESGQIQTKCGVDLVI